MRFLRIIGVAVAGALAFGAALAHDAPARPAAPESAAWFRLTGKVTRVVDGDTIVVKIGRKSERVRLIGIDTPESGDCYAAEATAAARRLANGKRVRLLGDRTQARRDRFRRLLAYVTLPNGRDLGRELLAAGYAKVFVFDRRFARFARYAGAEAAARDAGNGMWSACAIQPADLVLAATAAPNPVTVGSNLTYTLNVSNASPATAETVALTNTIPATTTLVSAVSTQGTCAGTTVIACALGGIAGASITVTIVVRPTTAGTITNATVVSSSTQDANAANNSATLSTTVQAQPTPPPPSNCHPSYVGVCIPPPPPDLDCSQIPYRNFQVIYTVPNPDPHRFDSDRDGIGCES